MSLDKMNSPKDRVSEVRDMRRKLFDDLDAAGKSNAKVDIFFTDMHAYKERLERAHEPQYLLKVMAYHVLIGSTGITREVAPIDDFEGDESVKQFLIDMRKKYLKE